MVLKVNTHTHTHQGSGNVNDMPPLSPFSVLKPRTRQSGLKRSRDWTERKKLGKEPEASWSYRTNEKTTSMFMNSWCRRRTKPAGWILGRRPLSGLFDQQQREREDVAAGGEAVVTIAFNISAAVVPGQWAIQWLRRTWKSLEPTVEEWHHHPDWPQQAGQKSRLGGCLWPRGGVFSFLVKLFFVGAVLGLGLGFARRSTCWFLLNVDLRKE